jgi:hypothetical protein
LLAWPEKLYLLALNDRAETAWVRHRVLWLAAFGIAANCLLGISARAVEPLPGTEPYVEQGDLAEQTLDGIARFLLERTEQSVDGRAAHWNRNLDSPDAYRESMQPNRERFRHILGAVDVRQPVTALELIATTALPAKVAETDGLTVWAVRWPVVGPITGEGLLLEPKSPVRACVVALPDADQSPEQLVGLLPGVAAESQFAGGWRKTAAGCWCPP